MVLSLNHRLNILGYLNLAAYGDKYADSTNAGVLDLVMALHWVRDNIAAFGGDPGNVTVFGQSGGGGKVSTFASMPMAKGLFHKGVVKADRPCAWAIRSRRRNWPGRWSAELGLTKATIDKIQTVPYMQLLAAGDAGNKTPSPGSSLVIGRRCPAPRAAAQRLGFSPVVDGKYVTRHPFDPDAPDESANVPMLIGTR